MKIQHRLFPLPPSYCNTLAADHPVVRFHFVDYYHRRGRVLPKNINQ